RHFLRRRSIGGCRRHTATALTPSLEAICRTDLVAVQPITLMSVLLNSFGSYTSGSVRARCSPPHSLQKNTCLAGPLRAAVPNHYCRTAMRRDKAATASPGHWL